MLIPHLVTSLYLLVSVTAYDAPQKCGLWNRDEEISRILDEFATRLPRKEHLTDIKFKTLTQRLDHFAPSVMDTWEQRYAENLDHYRGNNLIFLMIGGAGAMNELWLKLGLMAKQAEKFKAATFVIEHRFYGESRPGRDLTTKSLQYLSSDQALADYAHFITQMNLEHGFKNPKWIVFGASYGGSLAAWLRYKYPHLVYAALSSSGSLFAKADFHEWFEVITKSLSTLGGPKCVDAIKTANKIMSENVHNKKKREYYRDLFDLCEPFEGDKKEISSFFWSMAFPFFIPAQSLNKKEIEKGCAIMTDESIKSPVNRYAKYNEQFRGNELCQSIKYSTIIGTLNDTAYGCGCGGRQWWYQCCTEFGWYMTSNRKDDTFGDKIDLDFFNGICTKAYDIKFDIPFVETSANETNLHYGGYDLPVTRVVFVTGQSDPWAPLSITSKPPKGSIAISIKGGTHCSDILPERDTDTEQVKRARAKISRTLERWTKGKEFEEEEEEEE
nr:PREDICTED: putative serine protease K12H4.7 [Bemisia tabaci]